MRNAISAVSARVEQDLGSEVLASFISGVAVDSRKVRPGDLFVCVIGETTDGHLFAADAVQAGAVAVLAQYDPFAGSESPVPVLLVQDSVKALGLLGRYWRDLFPGVVIGITGSAGKTTTKEILSHILSLRGETAKNPLNLNTQVGLPLSMLATSGQEEYWVMEAGISKPGDMDELGPILAPDLVVILNVGPAHVQGLGNLSVAHYKASLLKYLRPGGMALISADYPGLVKETRKIFPMAVYFSITGKQLNYRASYQGLSEEGRGFYNLWLDGSSLEVSSELTGPYGAENIIAAAAAGHLLGLKPGVIAHGIEDARLPRQRFSKLDVPGWLIIDDSYNSNPLSSAKVLEAVVELARDRKLVCAMGEMLELGELSAQEHYNLGRNLAAAGSNAIFWLGDYGNDVEEGLRAEHFSGFFQPVADARDFVIKFAEWNRQRKDNLQGLILFKGSRGKRMETLLGAWLENGGQDAV